MNISCSDFAVPCTEFVCFRLNSDEFPCLSPYDDSCGDCYYYCNCYHCDNFFSCSKKGDVINNEKEDT